MLFFMKIFVLKRKCFIFSKLKNMVQRNFCRLSRFFTGRGACLLPFVRSPSSFPFRNSPFFRIEIDAGPFIWRIKRAIHLSHCSHFVFFLKLTGKYMKIFKSAAYFCRMVFNPGHPANLIQITFLFTRFFCSTKNFLGHNLTTGFFHSISILNDSMFE